MKAVQSLTRIDEFATLVNQGIQCWVKAGELVAQAVDDDPQFAERVVERYPQFTAEILWRFEQIGRKQVLPELLVSDCPGYRKLRQLPYEMQVRLLKSGVELLTEKNGGYDSLKVEPINLTTEQAKRVFASNRVRSLAEQRVWWEDQNRFTPPKASDAIPYRIKNGRLLVFEPTEFTRKDLARILSDLEP